MALPEVALVSLEMHLFGEFTLRVNGQAAPRMRARAGQWVLALLALRGDRETPREWLAATLWPESDTDQALYNLRRNLTDLRRVLGPAATRLEAPSSRSLRLRLAPAECDYVAFDEARRGGDGEAILRLYTGPLLDGCDAAWIAGPRRDCAEAFVSTCERLAGDAAGRGDRTGAVALLRRAVDAAPGRETAVRALMTVLAESGDHAGAVQAFRDLRLFLQSERLGAPLADTEILYRAIRERAGHRPSRRPVNEKGRSPLRRLPRPLTRLIGRDDEVAGIVATLSDARTRLLTLLGAGGIGKTRLAVAAADEAAELFAEGAWFVDLAPVADPSLVASAVVRALDLPPAESGNDPLTRLRRHLGDRSWLLVLDNCEHLVDACASLAKALLEACPALVILATSRQPLGVAGERSRRVPSLAEGAGAALFVERTAAAGQPGHDPSAVREIVRLMDGIPLAIEMAAAWASALPLREIARHLAESLALPKPATRGPDAASRHRTLRATLDWSYALLGEREQLLLPRLAVFADGWTLHAAEVVCDAGAIPIAALVERSLVLFDGRERYRLLETVRQYAGHRLRERGEGAELRRRHWRYYADLAAQAEAALRGPEQALWLDRLDSEHGNLRAAIAAALIDEPEASLRLAARLWEFWALRGYLAEGRQHLLQALETAAYAPPDACAAALGALGQIAHYRGDLPEAHAYFERALALARAQGDRAQEAQYLGCLGDVVCNQEDYSRARDLLERALALHRDLGDAVGEANNLTGLGYAARCQGDLPAARAFLERASALHRARGDRLAEGGALSSLANVLWQENDLDGARALFERALARDRRAGYRAGEAYNLCSLANLANARGEAPETVRTLLMEALAINRSIGRRSGEAWNLSSLAEVALREGDTDEAVRLRAEAAAL